MKELNILIYFHDKTCCNRLFQVLNQGFNLTVTYKQERFLQHATKKDIDIGIICCCFANMEDLSSLLKLKAETNYLPVIISSKIPNPDFISQGTKGGFNHFILCSMSSDKIKKRIQAAVNKEGLRKFVESHIVPEAISPYTQRIISEILNNMSGRMNVDELANLLGITRRWTQTLFQEIFGMTFTELNRRVRIYQALNLMKYSPHDNTEIALKLNYSEEYCLYRIFQKELGYSPTKARRYLIKNSPENLLNHYRESA